MKSKQKRENSGQQEYDSHLTPVMTSIENLRLTLRSISDFETQIVKELTVKFSQIDTDLKNIQTQLITETRKKIIEAFIPSDPMKECVMNLILKDLKSDTIRKKLIKILAEKLNLFQYPSPVTDTLIYNEETNSIRWSAEFRELSSLQRMQAFCLMDGSRPDILTSYHLLAKGWTEKVSECQHVIFRKALLAWISNE